MALIGKLVMSSNQEDLVDKLNFKLVDEQAAYFLLHRTPEAQKLREIQADLYKDVKAIGKTDDVASILNAEKILYQNELRHFANSAPQRTSLKTGLEELANAQKALPLVHDKALYEAVNISHGQRKDRINGVPKDAVQKFLASNRTRLLNMDKSRLSPIEKKTINTRRNNMTIAQKAYTKLQQKSLGIVPKEKPHNQERSLWLLNVLIV